MHMIIRAIVYAENKEDALDEAKSIFEEMCGEGKAFDYYTTFDEENTVCSGKARWGALPVAALASSKEGEKLIDDGIKYTKNDFIEALKSIRKTLEENIDGFIWDCEYGLDQFRYRCNIIGEYTGAHTFLYTLYGEGIKSEKELKNVLNKHADIYKGKENPYRDDDVWVIPADVHY